MTDKGKNIREMMRQMKPLYQQIQLLLKTTDRAMQDRSWTSPTNYVTNFSNHIDSSEVWVIRYLARFYTNSEYKYLLPFVSVILDDDVQIDEPLLTAGWFDSELGADRYDYWWPAVHVRQNEIFSDGRLRNVDTTCLNVPEVHGGKSLGVPLVEIDSDQALVERIIDPLVEGLKEARK